MIRNDPKVIVMPYPTRPARPHRQKRIHKKWLKRFGLVRVPGDYSKSFVVGDTFYVYPETAKLLREMEGA